MARHQEIQRSRLPEVLEGLELPDVLQVATELYARDRTTIERARQLQALATAAAEAGLPLEYLERAAVSLHAKREGRFRRRRRQRGTLAAAGVLLGLVTLWGIRSTGPPTEAYLGAGTPYAVGAPPGYGGHGAPPPPGAPPGRAALPYPAPPAGYGPPGGYPGSPLTEPPGGPPGPAGPAPPGGDGAAAAPDAPLGFGGPPGYGPPR
jgi:hypothetical protein